MFADDVSILYMKLRFEEVQAKVQKGIDAGERWTTIQKLHWKAGKTKGSYVSMAVTDIGQKLALTCETKFDKLPPYWQSFWIRYHIGVQTLRVKEEIERSEGLQSMTAAGRCSQR